MVIGTLIGLAIGRSPVADRALRHYINGFYAMPMIVVLPLFSLWFGYTGATRIATIVFAAVFSIIINVADGARAVPREYHGSGALVRARAGCACWARSCCRPRCHISWPASGSPPAAR